MSLCSRRLTLGLLVKVVAEAVQSGLGDAFEREADPGEQSDDLEPGSPPRRLQLHAQRIADAVDNDATVEALERAHGIYTEHSIFQAGGNWEDVVGPALVVMLQTKQICSQRLMNHRQF